MHVSTPSTHDQPAQPRLRARRLGLAAGALALLAPPLLAAPRRSANAANRPHYPLAPGQSYWLPSVSPAGPLVAFVNLHTQHMQVYRNGVAIGYSSVSTGKPGHGTPTGLFTVLEKRRHHHSNLYSNAPMPWMLRLTWGGIAFHGGALPGYPASHGCIRLPMNFAPQLFSVLGRGDTVAVLRHATQNGAPLLPLLAPVDPRGQPLLQPEMLSSPTFWAADEASAPGAASASAPPRASGAGIAPTGASPVVAAAPATAPQPVPAPLTLIASLAQRRLFVLQHGRIRAAGALPASAAQWTGAQLFTWSDVGQWQAAAQAGDSQDAPLWRTALPAQHGFDQRLRAQLTPGSTLLISPLPAVSDVHAAAWQLAA